jgi:flagellum-specific ATP synthase
LPQLVERAGNGPVGKGAITAIYTVLTEGDDQQDPVADAARAILDGHIVLSRQLAESGVYPAIDVEASISRVMPQVVDSKHLQAAQLFKQVYATYRQNQDLINIGAYNPGSDPQIDHAIQMFPQLRNLLKQDMHQAHDWQQSVENLQQTLQAAPTTVSPPARTANTR